MSSSANPPVFGGTSLPNLIRMSLVRPVGIVGPLGAVAGFSAGLVIARRPRAASDANLTGASG